MRAPFSFASATAVATISSPMSPSFIGTRMFWNDAPTGNELARVDVLEHAALARATRVQANTTSPSASHAGPA